MYVCMHTRPYACRTGTGDPMWCSVWRVLAILSQLVDSIPRPFLSICPHSFTSPSIHLSTESIDVSTSIYSSIYPLTFSHRFPPLFMILSSRCAKNLEQQDWEWRSNTDTNEGAIVTHQQPSVVNRSVSFESPLARCRIHRPCRTCKSGPNIMCLWHFDFEMCFVPQQRAPFQHLDFQKWSENGVFWCVFCASWLHLTSNSVLRATAARTLFQRLSFQKCSDAGVLLPYLRPNVLRATVAYTFSTSQLPKVFRTWCVLNVLPCNCASRDSGVQFLISHFPGWLRTRRFSEPTFGPSGTTKH